ncbi:MAG: hypothetical protein GXX79_04435 [Actinomycetales bacterium]|nr:hypothetical protein [Actinomycetales bacterium]
MSPGPGDRGQRRGERFELFAECLLIGVLVAVTALGVVTVLAALAAGCAQVRAVVTGRPAALADYRRRLRGALPGSRGASAALVAGLLVLGYDALVAGSGLPGGPVVLPAIVVLAAAVGVVVLRAVASWREGAAWRSVLLSTAPRAAVADLGGSVLLAAALGAVVVIGWQLPPLAAPSLGVLALAAVAVEDRRTGAPGTADPEYHRP